MSPLLFGLERGVYTRIARLALEDKGGPTPCSDTFVAACSDHLRRRYMQC